MTRFKTCTENCEPQTKKSGK